MTDQSRHSHLTRPLVWLLFATSIVSLWALGRLADVPFDRKGLIYDALTDSLYVVTLVPALDEFSRKNIIFGFGWGQLRVIDRVDDRLHVLATVQRRAEMRKWKEDDFRRFGDSILSHMNNATTHAGYLTAESGFFSFTSNDLVASSRDVLVLQQLGIVDVREDEIVPIHVSLHRRRWYYLEDGRPDELQVVVMNSAYLLRGRVETAVYRSLLR